MVKQTKTIRRLLPTNCLSVFNHFVGLTLKGFKYASDTAQLASIYFFKCNNGDSRKICSNVSIKTPERYNWHLPGTFIVNFEQISQIVLVFTVDFEQGNTCVTDFSLGKHLFKVNNKNNSTASMDLHRLLTFNWYLSLSLLLSLLEFLLTLSPLMSSSIA